MKISIPDRNAQTSAATHSIVLFVIEISLIKICFVPSFESEIILFMLRLIGMNSRTVRIDVKKKLKGMLVQ